ncbi:hypothetical protein COCNU_03G016360 [Cocos nucifera]|uniref:Uncharacterized protein n=1 Tax=Cocos nucifera TaxID=13894 RepID=A0A8K0MZ26_COCNU|nr:hypothetical protein COCNU_03G016360 [Cocos nucifera]
MAVVLIGGSRSFTTSWAGAAKSPSLLFVVRMKKGEEQRATEEEVVGKASAPVRNEARVLELSNPGFSTFS